VPNGGGSVFRTPVRMVARLRRRPRPTSLDGMTEQTILTPDTGSTGHEETTATRPRRRVLVARFVRHYAEMVLAMFAGMLVLGAAVGIVTGVAGVDYSREAHPYLAAIEMTVTMSAGMAFWMRWRRHHWRHVAEMTAAMVLPLVFLFPLAWTGGIEASSLMMLDHTLMFPLMLVVMLRAPHAYTGPVVGRLRNRPGLRKVLRGLVVTAVAIAVPLGLGFRALAERTADSYAIADRPAEVDAAAVAAAPVPAHDPAKPTAVMVVGAKGAVSSDTLGPYEALAASGAFNTYVVAPERRPVPLSGGLDLVPQLTFAQLADRLGGKAPDAVLVPAMPDTGEASNAPVRDWLVAEKEAGALIVSICNGAEVLASAGLLDGREATAHWYRVGDLEELYPGTTWRRGVRYVDTGDVVTTAGILSGIDGALRVIERLVDEDTARATASAVSWRHYSPGRPAAIPVNSTLPLGMVALLNAGYRSRPAIGVRLENGVGELATAAVFDAYDAQSFAARTIAVSAGGDPVTSAHGLTFVPRSTPGDPELDRTVVPGTTGFPYDAALTDVARTADAPTARWAAQVLEYHPDELELDGPGLSPALVARPVLLALGVAALLLALLAGLSRANGLLRRRIAARTA
jgi:putative intracellular protease/amidase